MPKRTDTSAVEYIAQMTIVHVLTLMIVLGLASFVGSKVHTDLEGVDRPAQVMETRPNAPGSDAAIWAQHEEKCWRYNPKGQVTGALLRINPNDPFVYTRKPRLVERALDQAVNHTDRGLDRVLAFCTDHITQEGK